MRIEPQNTLAVFALEDEAQTQFDDFPKVFCGVGKVNAVYHVTRALYAWRAKHGRDPDLVLNLGSAGSATYSTRSVVNCTGFIQRDIDTTSLGTDPYTTFAEGLPALLSNGLRIGRLPQAICGSGDNFVNDGTMRPWNVVDM